jgi:hypothetical protein
MLMTKHLLLWTALLLASMGSRCSYAQTADRGSSALSDEQKLGMAKAQKDFGDAHWPEAFAEFQTLHEELPGNITITEFLAESALNTGQLEKAHDLLEPIVKTEPDRWEAVGLLTRYYAETKNDSARDAGLAEMQRMHDSGRHPRLSAQNTVLLERHPTTDGGSVGIWYSLKPWGRFNAYLYARYLDANGHETSYMTLESSDMDQVSWAKQHPAEAAAGQRVFSLDFYRVPVKNQDGTMTGFHATMGFYDGRPTYNQIRDRMTSSAGKPSGAISNTQQNIPRSESPHQ